jgi:hypothetical protein
MQTIVAVAGFTPLFVPAAAADCKANHPDVCVL